MTEPVDLATQSKLAAIIESTDHCVIVMDPLSGITWVNDGFTQLFGFAIGEARGKTPRGLLAIDLSDPAVLEEIRLCIVNLRVFRGELQCRDKSGAPIWLDVEMRPTYDQNGKNDGHTYFGTDITALRDARNALADEKERLSQITKGIEAGIGEWNLNTGLVNLDARLARIIGDKPESWVNAPSQAWIERCHQSDMQALNSLLSDVMSGRTAQINFEFRMLHSTKRWITILLRAHVSERSSEGKARKITGIYIDVTKERQQDARWQIRAKLSADCYWSTDENHRITECSLGVSQITGYPTESLIGKHFDSAAGHAFGAPLISDRARPVDCFEKQEPFKGFVFSITNANGKQIWIEIDGTPTFDFHGQFLGFEGVGRNVTYKREHEQALTAAKDAAEAANVAKSAFLATMSHEIRTPMNGVLGMSEMLSTSHLDDDQAETVDIIRQSASSLMTIIDDILDFSKLDASRVEMDEQSVDLSSLVFSTVDSLLPIALSKSVKLRSFVDPRLPKYLLLDDTRLRQILNNLIGNAIKFSSKDIEAAGSVYVRATTWDNTHLTITVSDNGIGIEPINMEKIFQVFNQAEKSTTRRFGGTGLGLAISKRLAELMGGDISVQSELGVGSSFKVTLPLIRTGESIPTPVKTLAGKHCVLVGGTASESHDLTSHLRFEGATVINVHSLEAAFQGAQDMARPTIIIHGASIDSEHKYIGSIKRYAWPRQTFHLLLSDGARKSLRMIDDTVACIDWSHSSVLTNAVAMVSSDRKQIVIRPWASANGSDGNAGSKLSGALNRIHKQSRLSPHLKILIAEDDPINQKVIRKQLQHMGVTADIVETGQEALERWLERRDYAILLTDLHMPVMDGYELARQIRANETGAERLPILALTANAVTGETFEAYKSGIDLYLTKPILLEDLHAAISTFALDSAAPAEGIDTHVELIAGRSFEPTPSLVLSEANEQFPHWSAQALHAVLGDDPETTQEFLETFRNEARSMVDSIATSLRKRQNADRRGVAHRLKSASRSVGAMWLGELSSQIERLSDLHEQDDAQTLASELEAAFSTFIATTLNPSSQSLGEQTK